ncbi:hypothetical protein LLH06_04675 [Mucilaginibacter daejeonensis]|uniref:hypothetical protein n=1 Tax=Mucilaginibacter daejeonensis TaxID=398049 RepID=UPI001D170673|nr:hypothetical protein [Mucilaginibacter daejeonensis]UEG54262.1 hypothetical protein LLH06_04675 [Mucilaginibacter daejeonensis]
MIKYCYIIILSLFVASCKKDNAGTPPSNDLKGTWRQTSYGGGFDGKTYQVPADSVLTITFNGSSGYESKRNGKLTHSGTYEVGKAKSIYSGEMEDAIQLDGNGLWSIIKIDGNALHLSINAYDAGGSTYTRVN